MSKNSNLNSAKSAKNDEFYTKISDIENELKYYRNHFKDAVVFCNCDDPEWSNFWRYFHLNFEFLGLKKLITTHYDAKEPTYKMEYTGGSDNDISVGTVTPLQQNGDFRSPECIELLKEADIVVTNPPFSLFRDYVEMLLDYEKKFLIIGNINAVSYERIFESMKSNNLWQGYTSPKEFTTIDGTVQKFGNILWFTNLDIKKRHEELELIEYYDPEKYPKYVNYDAIEVSRVYNIPKDYSGNMGVPVSFMDKYNPDQFEIIGISRLLVRTLSDDVKEHGNYAQIGRFYIDNHDGTYRKMYERLVVRLKNPVRKDVKTDAD